MPGILEDFAAHLERAGALDSVVQLLDHPDLLARACHALLLLSGVHHFDLVIGLGRGGSELAAALANQAKKVRRLTARYSAGWLARDGSQFMMDTMPTRATDALVISHELPDHKARDAVYTTLGNQGISVRAFLAITSHLPAAIKLHRQARLCALIKRTDS